jgi:membrane associated rhomboid family serine protease
LGGGLGAWLFARPFYHVGASGIVYGLVTFIFFYGIIRKEKQSIGFALIVTFLYGSMVWGVLPIVRGISWESHLSGAIAGLFSAIIYRKAYPPMISHSAAEDEEGQDEYFE